MTKVVVTSRLPWSRCFVLYVACRLFGELIMSSEFHGEMNATRRTQRRLRTLDDDAIVPRH